MTSFISHTTIDCHDAYALAQWWKRALDYTDLPDDPNSPGDEECMILDPATGHKLLFIEVPDAELPEKRVHFDLRPREGSQQQEVDYMLGIGATLVVDRRGIYGPDSGWIVMADPEGNQFCVLRPRTDFNQPLLSDTPPISADVLFEEMSESELAQWEQGHPGDPLLEGMRDEG